MLNKLLKLLNKDPIITFNLAYPKMLNVFPKPVSAVADIPEWYKKQPGYYNNDRSVVDGVMQLTVKKCQAIFDGMSSGYFLLAPVDIYIDTTEGKTIVDIPQTFKKLSEPLTGFHSTQQISEYPLDQELYIDNILRIHPVWLISTPKEYSCLFLMPMHHNLPIHAVPAVVDSDNFLVDGLLSYFVKKNYKGTIKQGTPLIQVIPFKREKWSSVINEHFDKKIAIEQKNNIRSVFENGYRKKLWVKKEYR